MTAPFVPCLDPKGTTMVEPGEARLCMFIADERRRINRRDKCKDRAPEGQEELEKRLENEFTGALAEWALCKIFDVYPHKILVSRRQRGLIDVITRKGVGIDAKGTRNENGNLTVENSNLMAETPPFIYVLVYVSGPNYKSVFEDTHTENITCRMLMTVKRARMLELPLTPGRGTLGDKRVLQRDMFQEYDVTPELLAHEFGKAEK